MLNEEELRNAALPKMELSMPDGENPVEVIEQFFGCTATTSSEMPEDSDVDGSVVINLK